MKQDNRNDTPATSDFPARSLRGAVAPASDDCGKGPVGNAATSGGGEGGPRSAQTDAAPLPGDRDSLHAPGAAAPALALENALRRPGTTRRPAIVAYLTAGYPSPERFARLLPEVAAVTDAVEIGVPFSDPVADGVTIQRASRASLEAGTSLRGILDLLGGLAPRPASPLLLMSYLNPLLAFGLVDATRAMAEAGVSGLIVPDLPFEESGAVRGAMESHGLALVQLVTPLTPPDRLERLCRASRGFVYAVTVAGTTGGETAPDAGLSLYLERVRAVSPVPVLAGFGIREPGQVHAIAGHADGVVIGSALLDMIDRGEDPAAFLRELRAS
jgi:tryptophan synthase alpha chain